ncbi:acetamidase/formamidase family protein [Methylocapsa sp. S129]|uniref:acetamidase/formamidase family protein n=1 Tax=Methylocapsa sp. S129 TaxID=1641869 RepID=UPI00131B513C|nr:acetamidase/formamidase family protein [Methylocapsa sp. S129]
MTDESFPYVFHYGAGEPRIRARLGEPLCVFTEDCFSGKLVAVDGKPREVAPFPRVNPLTGPIAIEGVRDGDTLAIHLVSLKPARDWGVSTVSPNFGALSGTRNNPNLQPEQAETVWIWRVGLDGMLTTTTTNGREISAPLRPFHGSLGVAPPHGEVRLSVVPDSFGGNLDIPDLGAGATLYLRANVDEAMVYIGDGHFAQGDGELAGTAVEGALNTELIFATCGDGEDMLWPRLETDTEIAVIGCARPLEDAVRIAAHGLVHWVSRLCGLEPGDAHQLVSQNCRLRIGNLVNPLYTVAAFIDKKRLPRAISDFEDTHQMLRSASKSSTQ